MQIARTKNDAELMKAGLSVSVYGYDGSSPREDPKRIESEAAADGFDKSFSLNNGATHQFHDAGRYMSIERSQMERRSRAIDDNRPYKQKHAEKHYDQRYGDDNR